MDKESGRLREVLDDMRKAAESMREDSSRTLNESLPIRADFDMDPQHGPIIRVRVFGRWVSVYLMTENGVVTEPSGSQYGIEVKGPWWKFRQMVETPIMGDGGEWGAHGHDGSHTDSVILRIKTLEKRVAKLTEACEKARLELLEGECEPTDNAVEILSAALTEKPR